MQDTTHSIIKSARRFLSGTMLSRVFGMLRDVAMAYAFGTQESVAAFLVAFRLSHLMRRLFGEGALQSAFIPQFESLRQQDPKRAYGFFRTLALVLTLGLLMIITLSMLGLGAIWSFGGLSEGTREIVGLTFLLMPGLLFICLYGLNASLLQCEKSYFTPGVAPMAFNVIAIAGVLSLRHLSATEAMPWFAGWVVFACMAQWAVTVPRLLRILAARRKELFHNLSFHLGDLRIFVKPLLLSFLGVGATQINNALDAIFARFAQGEGPAYLWYALRIQQLPIALFGVALAGAILPPLTRALKSGDQAQFENFLIFGLQRTCGFIFPVTIAIWVMGDLGISVLFGRGDFGLDSILGTAKCLLGYSFGLLPMVLVLVLAPAFYAQGNQRIPAIASIIAVIANASLDLLFIVGFGWGAVSVALATSVSAWANVGILAWKLKAMHPLLTKSFWQSINRMALVSVTAGSLVLATRWLMFGKFFPEPQRGFEGILQLLLQGGLFTLPLLLKYQSERVAQRKSEG